MTTLIRSVIVALAVLTGLVLLLLGIREIRAGRGRHGLFVTTLLGVLGTAACTGAAGSRTQVETPAGQAGGTTQPDQADTSLVAQLSQTTQWEDFKAFWKKLGDVEPTQKDAEPYIGEYYNAITSEQAESLYEELGRVMAGLRKPGMNKYIGDLEIDLFETICQKRIDYLQYGMQSMLTRMMPPPMMTEKEGSIRDLETHIDVLVDMRASGEISGEEFDAALGIVENDIQSYAVLEALSASFAGYYLPLPKPQAGEDGTVTSQADALIDAFEEDYARFQLEGTDAYGSDTSKELEKQYEKAKRTIDELKLALPYIAELIEDLEH